MREEQGQHKEQDAPLPPRRKAHPSNKLQMIRWFYRTLVLVFLLLTGGLIAWGVQFLE